MEVARGRGDLERRDDVDDARANERGIRATVYTHWSFGFGAGAGPIGTDDPAFLPTKRWFNIWSKLSRACAAVASRRVPLSARGLSGGKASQLRGSDTYECVAPSRAYVRIRGVFRTPASLRLDPVFSQSHHRGPAAGGRARGFEPKIDLSATSGFRDSGKWSTLASGGISNQGSNPTILPPNEAGLRATVYTQWGFGFSAGAGALAPRDPAAPPVRRGFRIWSKVSKACAPASSRRVPLSPRGLSGGVASQLSDEYECPAPRRVYLRIRGVFRSPASLRLDRRFLYHNTEVPLKEAAIAVRSESGKPLAFVAVSESGKARIFTAPSCAAD